MHTTPITYDRRAVTAWVLAGVVMLGAIFALVYAMYAAHQGGSGIVPAPAPVVPAAPVEPAPLGPPTVLIPDNA